MTATENTSSDASDDVVRATRRGRLGTAALALCTLFLLAFFQLYVFPLLHNTLDAEPTAQNISRLKWILVGIAVTGILPALYMMVTGWKTRRSGRFPLPGAWVLRDTRIKRGTEAMRIGAFCIVSGAIACLICIGVLAYIWIMFDRLPPEYTLPQGVIILQQPPAVNR